MDLTEVFKAVETILVIDWPDQEVPEVLARAGFHVVVRGGPRPEDYSSWDFSDGEIMIRNPGHPPKRADLIYSYRPFNELPEIVATAAKLHTKFLWVQSGLSAAGIRDSKGCWISCEQLQSARDIVETAALRLITEPYIVDAVRHSMSIPGRDVDDILSVHPKK
jgi:predicted CoA-binding protein